MKINGKTSVYGFFGQTYEHSLTYALYNSAFKALNINAVYIPFRINNLNKAVEGIRNLGIKGVGVTIPYKERIIPLLDKLDKNAQKIGAVNLVINKDNVLIGGITDGWGALKALEEITPVKGKKIIILGAGGASLAIVHTLKEKGGSLTILNRTLKSAKEIAGKIKVNFGSLDLLDELLPDTDILINATSVGMFPNVNHTLIKPSQLSCKLIVQELVLTPRITQLVQDAKQAGCKVITGERTLLWQAIEKFKLFTGQKAPTEVMEKVLLKVLERRK